MVIDDVTMGMERAAGPLVSIVTPVYNGEEFLAECIESVLAQSYTHWDYTIVNNCSNDRSLAIAQAYAATDPRIRIVDNERFLNILENHNHAVRQISPGSKYFKFVFADDWLYSNCLDEMVGLAERNPSVGVVCAYTMDGHSVRWHGPEYPAERLPGREVCRQRLLGGPYVFGTMTSLLIRSDLARERPVFFNVRNLQSDMEVCFELLQESEFGFIHQVLSFVRDQKNTNDSFAARLNSHRLADFVIFLKYGSLVLDDAEYQQHIKTARRQYYRMLAHNVLRLRGNEFWKFHKDALAEVGERIDPWLVMTSVLTEATSQMGHPVSAFKRGCRWWFSHFARTKDAKKPTKPMPKEVADGC